MPEWTAPFHLPHVTTEEFLKLRSDYVSKYGHRYSIPGFDDIFKIPFENPITPEEEKKWKKRDPSLFSPERYEELKSVKNHRREKYLDMLGSPSPQIFRNRGSLLQSIDDAEDAISTLAAIGIVTAKALPRALPKVVSGAIGWIMTATEILNFATLVLSPERLAMDQKRLKNDFTDLNPKSKKGKAKRAKKLKKAKLGSGAIIEALQVTESIFGIGISLGAIMNCPIDIISGAVRATYGEYSAVKWPIPDFPKWKRRLMKMNKALLTHFSRPIRTDDVEFTKYLIATNLAAQYHATYMNDWQPLDAIVNFENLLVEAPKPESLFVLEIIEETDPEGLDAVGWPSTMTRWAPYDAISMSSKDIITDNFKAYSERNKHNWMGFVGATNAVEGSLFNIEALEGPGSVDHDYIVASKVFSRLYDAGYTVPDNLSDTKKQCFSAWLEDNERLDYTPDLSSIFTHAGTVCGFNFIRRGY